MDGGFVAQAAACLGETAQILVYLCDRTAAVPAAFLALPRQSAGSGVEPVPVVHELLEA